MTAISHTTKSTDHIADKSVSAAREKFEKGILQSRGQIWFRLSRLFPIVDAEDLLQKIYAEALASRIWESVEDPPAWIIGVYKNYLKRERHARRGKPIMVPLFEREISGSGDDEGQTQTSAIAPDFADEIIEKLSHEQEVAEQMQEIWRLAEVANMNERERYVIEARLRDESYGEIAVALGIGANAARAYHSQALVKIRAARAQS